MHSEKIFLSHKVIEMGGMEGLSVISKTFWVKLGKYGTNGQIIKSFDLLINIQL